ncbi:MAG: pyruvate kinase [Planctomycetes bacterium]|nr:pyruvate kinase [Planctomycetota bacterium]
MPSPNACFRRTKIICTLGPASANRKTLERMIRAGMNVARLNFSHGEYEAHARMLAELRAASEAAGVPVGVLQDLCGPKIRVGTLPGDAVEIADGEVVTLASVKRGGKAPAGALPIEYPALADDLTRGDRMLFDDGGMEAHVLSISRGRVKVRFASGGTLKSRKGLNLPGAKLSIPSVTKKDLQDLEWGIANRVDFVALSFVRRPEDLDPVRKRLAKVEFAPWLIAKIEKPEALEKLEDIVKASDGIMVARGDLGVELAFERVPPIQKRLIQLCNRLDTPVITATQMLESMTQHPRPTRAEVSDVSNAILDGTGAVMLSGETAVGKYPVETVATMSRIAEEAERFKLGADLYYKDVGREAHLGSLHDALALGVEKIARSMQVRAIVAVTHSSTTARYVSSSRPRVPVLGLSPDPRAVGRMTLLWGVTPLPCRRWRHTSEVLRQGVQQAKKRKLVTGGDTLVVAVGREKTGTFTGRILIHQIP